MQIQNFLTANIDWQNLLRTSNFQTLLIAERLNEKGPMKLPYRLHKGILGEIVLRGELDFMEHDMDSHQDKE